tara:strand:- start:1066 stop:1275 length:210 start_codon:yes stop_codon:yes gene_type:complete
MASPADGSGDVLIEIYQVGNSVKATAVDVRTGVEVSIVGSPSVGEEMLKRNAVKKLQYVLRKRAESGGR